MERMSEEAKEKYIQAGKIAAKAMNKVEELITPKRKKLQRTE